jgi:polysaccharide export outer membrane protein
VYVFGFSEHSGEAAVNEAGAISLPLVGVVSVEGKPVEQVQRELTALFMKYIRHPKIRLTVNQYNSQRVSVVGAVVRPGLYPLKHVGYLLTELLAEVGGVKDNGGNRLYIIPAQGNEAWAGAQSTGSAPGGATAQAPRGRSAGVEIDLEELVGTLDRPPILLPLVAGDTVIIPEAGQFRVNGEVENPGSFPVSRRTSALAAVAAAGGFTYAANVNEVEVIRDIGGGKKASKTIDLEQVAFRGASDIGLRDGDVVLVPSAPGRFRARQVVEAFRSVFRGGVTGSVRYQ